MILTPDDERYILAAADEQITKLRALMARDRKIAVEEVPLQEVVKFWVEEAAITLGCLEDRPQPPRGCRNWHYTCRCGVTLTFHAADLEHAFRVLEYRRWVSSWRRNAGWPDWFCSHACDTAQFFADAERDARYLKQAKERA